MWIFLHVVNYANQGGKNTYQFMYQKSLIHVFIKIYFCKKLLKLIQWWQMGILTFTLNKCATALFYKYAYRKYTL